VRNIMGTLQYCVRCVRCLLKCLCLAPVPTGFFDRLRAEVRLLGSVSNLGLATNETVELLQVLCCMEAYRPHVFYFITFSCALLYYFITLLLHVHNIITLFPPHVHTITSAVLHESLLPSCGLFFICAV